MTQSQSQSQLNTHNDEPRGLRGVFSGYCDYVQKKLRDHTFVYALIIVPVSSLSTVTLDSLPDAPVQDNDISAYEQGIVNLDHALLDVSDASLAPDEEIRFVFDEGSADSPEARSGIDVSLYPDTPHDITWEDNVLVLHPLALWSSGEQYSLAINNSVSSDGKVTPSKMYHFRVHGAPQVIGQTPESTDKGFIAEVGAQFDVIFDRPIDDYSFRAVSDGAIVQTSQESLPLERRIIFTLEQDVDRAQTLEMILYARHRAAPSDAFEPIGKIEFLARTPQPEAWPEDADERVELSIDRTIPKITEGKYIDINLEARLTTLFEDGIAVLSFVNSPGADATPTPTGEFKIENKGLKPVSRSFGVYLPYWMAFTPDGLYGIHDLVEWPAGHPDYPDSPNGGKESISSIDAAVSPGCVRHGTAPSGEIYEWTDVGTPVIIY